MLGEAAPDWMDKTGFGVIGRFALDDGEQLTAEIVGYDEDVNALLVQPLSTRDLHVEGEGTPRAIVIENVVSFDPEPRSAQAWPHSDPCRTEGFSLLRFCVLASLFLGSTVGSLALFVALMNSQPYRLQELSQVPYTLGVVWLTFAAHRSAPRFLLSCPAVKPQLLTLFWRHICFVLALFLLETTALSIRLGLPTWWTLRDSKGRTPFEMVLMLLCIGLAFAEVYTNRSTLKRAHSVLPGQNNS